MARTAGSKNKNKDRLLRQIKKEFPDYDPIIDLVRIATTEGTTTAERIQCNTTVAKYTYPALKAIDYSSSDGSIINKIVIAKDEADL